MHSLRLSIAVVLALLFSLSMEAAAGGREVTDQLAAANALLQSSKVPEAQVAFEQVLVSAPGNGEASCALALIACNTGDWEKALLLAEKAVATDATNARYQYVWGAANGLAAMKGGMLSKMGHAKKCLAAYRRASELEPDNAQYRWALLNYYQQAPGFAGGDMELAYVQAAAIKKQNPEAGARAFVQLYLAQKKYDLAFRVYDEALRANPDDLSSLYGLGRVALMSNQRLDDGLSAFRRCLSLPAPAGAEARNRADLHWRIGTVLEAKRQPQEAMAEYSAALRDLPGFPPATKALEKLGGPKA